MGQEASKPKPGTTFRVIGAGLPRTGTASFSKALSILLDGPIYHGGTQTTLGPESEVRTWISVLQLTPIKSTASSQAVHDSIKSLTNGYAAITDTPGAQFVPELLSLYPEAKVISTVRDPEAWAQSIDRTAQASLPWFLRFVLAPLPTMRWFPTYVDALQEGRWGELYVKPEDPHAYGRIIWDRHMAYLESVVPKEKLVFYDVREGWAPLCEALGCEVPKDVAFPRINDGDAMDEFAKKQVKRGMMRWAAIVAVGAMAVVAVRRLL